MISNKLETPLPQYNYKKNIPEKMNFYKNKALARIKQSKL